MGDDLSCRSWLRRARRQGWRGREHRHRGRACPGESRGSVGELMLLEVAPASFDIFQFGGVFRQPFEGEPGALGDCTGCQLATMDWSVVENCDQGPVSF